jgi:hypothetical protein
MKRCTCGWFVFYGRSPRVAGSDARSVHQAAQAPVDLDLLRTATRRFGRDAADELEEFLAR